MKVELGGILLIFAVLKLSVVLDINGGATSTVPVDEIDLTHCRYLL